MERSLVSIIVPCYNQAQFLSETLESVIAQSYSTWECIIVNDGSTDHVEEVAMLYCEADIRFKYFAIDNSGVSVARNKGISRSKGKYILPLDADDKIGPNYLKNAVRLLDTNELYKLVYCKAELFGEESGLWNLPEYNFQNLLLDNMIFCSALFRRADYDKTSGYNANMIFGWEDWDFWLSLLNDSDLVYCLPDVNFFYRKRQSTRSSGLNEIRSKEMRKQLYLNHIDIYVAVFGDPIYALLQINELDRHIGYLNKEINRIEYLFSNFRNSFSFKVGRFITSPFRLFRNLS